MDDIVITRSDSTGISSLKSFLHGQFHTKDLGMLRYFLGIEVMWSIHEIFLSQKKYVLDLLSEIGKLGAKPCSSPMAPGLHLTKEGELFEDPERYRRLFGKLNYLIVTRPNIAHSVSVVNQYMSSSTVVNWAEVFYIVIMGIIGLNASQMLIGQGQRKIEDPHLVTVFLLVEI